MRLSGDGALPDKAIVAEEVPVALVYNGRSHAVMMATPADLEDFAAGFSFTENIVGSLAELERTEVVRVGYGIELQCTVPPNVADELRARTRQLPGRGGCGLCGKEAIADVMRTARTVTAPLRVTPAALWRAGAALSARQALNADTHAVHAAAWATAEGELQVVREDVGRHNALDKVVGALLRADVDASGGFLVVTSRASYELVQKAAAAGVPLLAAVSRPTGLAVRMAQGAGMTLVALLRGESANVYAGAERIASDAAHDVS
jgi:formate dehydrogenase accessory protein FdhD